MLLSVLLEQGGQTGHSEHSAIVLGLIGVAVVSGTGNPHRQSLTASLDDHLLDAQPQTFLLQQRQHPGDENRTATVNVAAFNLISL